MHKDFNSWNDLKKNLDATDKIIFFKEREIWWCSLGLNIGHEENGKSQLFTRPVLIIRKFNNRLFIGVPLTTQIKENKYYRRFSFKDQEQCAMLSQIKVFEAKRLRKRMGELSEREFEQIRREICEVVFCYPQINQPPSQLV